MVSPRKWAHNPIAVPIRAKSCEGTLNKPPFDRSLRSGTDVPDGRNIEA